MKLFYLLASAAILTTNPLFAMNEPAPEDEGKAIPHLCSVCKPELRFTVTENEEKNGKGILIEFPDEVIRTGVLGNLSLQDMLTCSTTSKALYNLCQDPVLWGLFAQKSSFAPQAGVCIKSQFPSFFNLFSQWEEDTTYTLSQAQLQYFMKTPCEPSWWPEFSRTKGPGIASYQFSIGNNKFEMFVRCNPDGLGLQNDKDVIFREQCFQNCAGAVAIWAAPQEFLYCFREAHNRAYIMPLNYTFWFDNDDKGTRGDRSF